MIFTWAFTPQRLQHTVSSDTKCTIYFHSSWCQSFGRCEGRTVSWWRRLWAHASFIAETKSFQAAGRRPELSSLLCRRFPGEAAVTPLRQNTKKIRLPLSTQTRQRNEPLHTEEMSWRGGVRQETYETRRGEGLDRWRLWSTTETKGMLRRGGWDGRR